MKEWLEEMTDKKEEEFRVQFKDSIQIMAGALKAGYSAENAIRETCHDLKPILYSCGCSQFTERRLPASDASE